MPQPVALPRISWGAADAPRHALLVHGRPLLRAGHLEVLLLVPGARLSATYGEGDDHAEGMGLIGRTGEKLAMIVYDSPAAGRLTGDGAVVADVVRLPS